MAEARGGSAGAAVLRAAIARRWLVALMCVVVGALIGLAYAFLAPATYQSRAYVIAAATPSDTQANERRPVEVAQTLGRLIDQQEVVVAAAARVGLAPEEVATSVQGRTMPESSSIEIYGSAPTATQAADLTNAVADELVKLNTSRSAATGVTLSVLSPASVPTEPSSPVLTLDLGVGAGAGILLGALFLLATGGRRSPPDASQPVADPAGPPARAPGMLQQMAGTVSLRIRGLDPDGAAPERRPPPQRAPGPPPRPGPPHPPTGFPHPVSRAGPVPPHAPPVRPDRGGPGRQQ